MASFIESVTGAVREGFCSAFNNYLVSDNLLYSALRDFQNLVAPGATGWLYNSICNIPPQNSPQGFTGGQCNKQYDIKYALYYTYRRLSDNSIQTSNLPFGLRVRRQGPVTSVYVEQFGNSGIRVHHVGADGDSIYLHSADGLLNRTISCTLESLQVIPTDGSADNCGNPTPTPTQPLPTNSNRYTTNITYNDNQNRSITLSPTLIYGYATVNLNGQIEIPVQVKFDLNPSLNVTGNFNLHTGGFNVEIDPRFPGNGCGDSPTGYQPSPDTPPGTTVNLPDISFPSPTVSTDSVSQIRGVVVTVDSLGEKEGELFQNENPDIIIPNAGYVNFQIQIGASTAWTQDYPVKNRRHLIICDWPAGAINVKGTPRQGVTWTLSPVYTTKTFDARFPPES